MEEKEKFAIRGGFRFHDESELPPPLPSRSSQRCLSLRPVHSSPKTRSLPRRRQGPEDETSFESSTTTTENGNIDSVGSVHSERMLLHDTLKQLSVEKCTKKKAHITINRFIILTLVLTNTCSIITSSLTT